MLLTNAEKKILEKCGFKITSYSGRFMFGETTDAIVVNGDKGSIISKVCQETQDLNSVRDLIAKLSDAREDNMGKYDMVIY